MNPGTWLATGRRLRILWTTNASLLVFLLAWIVHDRLWGGGTPTTTSRWGWMLITAVVLLIAWWQYHHVASAISTLMRAIRGVEEADEPKPPRLALMGEYGALANRFNYMAQRVAQRHQQLQETVDRMSTVLGAMEEGVIAVDDRQRILFANRSAGKLLHFDAHQAVGHQMLEVIRNHMLHEAVSESLQNRDAGEKKLSRYELNAAPEASNQIISLHATPLPGEPCPGVLIVLEDVSELRRLEHLRQEFVANVSHELKTPLTAIKAYAETLAGGAIDDTTINRKFMAQIEKEADRLHDLIIDMLRLAQIESGHEQYEIRAVNLVDEVADCLNRHQASARRKEINLSMDSPTAMVEVRADRDGLREILDNLIDNAIKYTEPGGSVTVRWDELDQQVSLSVHDTGIGIPEEALSRVFERFYRVDKSRSRELGSTGLGLSIVKHIVQTFGGSVSVASEAGEGSTFTVQLHKP